MLEEILPPPIDNSALFVDMDSFFASVEQELHPEWRGRPVGVCPFVHDSTCILAASVEAKQHGVRTGTKIGEARRRCPKIILVAGNTSAYRDYHRRIMDKLESTRCQVKVRSIDEAYLRPPADLRPRATELALQIKDSIQEVGSQLHGSVGIAPNLFLAKLATTLQKPNGLVKIPLDGLEGTYALLRLRDLPGIGGRLEHRLKTAGVFSPLDFYRAPFSLLKGLMGQPGVSWYLRLRGYEVDLAPTHRYSIGHQTTIHPRPASTQFELLSAASQLAFRVATRLKEAGLAGQTVIIQLRFYDHTYWSTLHRGREPFFDFSTLWQHLVRLLPNQPPKPVRFVAVTVIGLKPIDALNQRLWDETEAAESLMLAVGAINKRYGSGTVQPARHLQGHAVSNQVGFGNAPQAAIELAP